MSDLWTGSIEASVNFRFEFDIDEGWQARDEDHVIELIVEKLPSHIADAWDGEDAYLTMTLDRDKETT